MERLGEPHPVLGSAGFYTYQDMSGTFDRACLGLLTELGLANGERLEPEFRETLRVLAQPGRELYCWSSYADPAGDEAFLVAALENDAVALRTSGDTVLLQAVEESRFVEEFVALLPEVPAARVPRISLARNEFDRRDENRDHLAGPGAADRLEAALKAPRDALHQLHVATRTDGGRQRSEPLSVIDLTGTGRILVYVDGHDRLQQVPGTPSRITAALKKAPAR